MPVTDWNELAEKIQTDLEITIQPPGSLFYAYTFLQPGWAKLPVIAQSQARVMATRLLATLASEQAKFDNARQPQNDNNHYRNLSEEGAAEADFWGERLDGWMTEVCLRSANDSPTSAIMAPPKTTRTRAVTASLGTKVSVCSLTEVAA